MLTQSREHATQPLKAPIRKPQVSVHDGLVDGLMVKMSRRDIMIVC